MKTKELLSFTFLLAASTATLLTAGIARADLVPDTRAHNACLDRLEAVDRREGLGLKTGDTYRAPQPASDRYHYFFNAETRGENKRLYRVECESRRNGKITRFALKPGQWRYEAPPPRGIASR